MSEVFSQFVLFLLMRLFSPDGPTGESEPIELTTVSFYGKLIMRIRVASLLSVWLTLASLFALVVWKVISASGRSDPVSLFPTSKSTARE